MRGVAATLTLGAAFALGMFAQGGHAETTRPDACTQGVDTAQSSISAEVYCGPASATVTTNEGRITVKPGTCVKGIRGPGSWDLYLGRDRSGAGPWPLTLHLSKPTASSKPGLTMERGFTQWTASSTIKLTLTANGGSFSGTALVRKNGKSAAARSPIKGTFSCK